MKKIHSQNEMEAVIRAVRRERMGSEADRGRRIGPWSFRQAGLLQEDHLRVVRKLHESFARDCANSLEAYLRVPCAATLLSVEQFSYKRFLNRAPELTYLVSVDLGSGATAVLQMDIALVLSVINLLLGGKGKAAGEIRDLTEIEEGIFESVVKILCQEWDGVWRSLGPVEFQAAVRQPPAAIPRLMAAKEKILLFSFELQVQEVRGALNLVFPLDVSRVLLRRGSREAPQKTDKRPGAGERLRQRLLNCRFPVELALPPSPVRGDDLLTLEPGQVLILQHKVEDPALLSAGGEPLFAAHPVRSGRLRGAQIQQRLKLSPDTAGGTK